jgi:Flp pilus assembly protein TadG
MQPCNAENTCPRPCTGAEEGSAVVEFVFLAVLLMIPVVYLIITLGQLQGGAYAVVGAADQAAKVYVAGTDPGAAQSAAEEAVMLAMADHGFNSEDAHLALECSPADCLTPGATVTATVTLRVPLPLVPTLPGVNPSVATVHAVASQLVGRFR